jgi:membrane protease YdiL (CAAX protease family)
VLFLITTQIVSVVYRATIEWRSTGVGTEVPNLPRPLYWIANVVFCGYGEEVGWRGFALLRLLSRFSALRASVVLTGGWAACHLPLFAFSAGL